MTGSALKAVSSIDSDIITSPTKPIPNPAISNCVSTTPPSITVLSPNGGEVYQAGQQITVNWKSCNIPANANIGIGMNWPGSWTLNFGLSAMSTTNSGTANLTLPSSSSFYLPGGFQSGQFYKVSVTAPYIQTGGISVFDVSDNQFTINKPGVINTTTTPTKATVTIPAATVVPGVTPTTNVAVTPTPIVTPGTPPLVPGAALFGHLMNYNQYSRTFNWDNDESTSDQVFIGSATCPNGKVLLSGGYNWSGTNNSDRSIFTDGMTASNRYGVGMFDPSHSTSGLTISIICADLVP